MGQDMIPSGGGAIGPVRAGPRLTELSQEAWQAINSIMGKTEERETTDGKQQVPIPFPAATQALVGELMQARQETNKIGWKPPTADDVFPWLTTLSVLSRNPQSAEDIEGISVALAWLLAETVPGWMFNESTLREACRKFPMWPAGAQIAELLEPKAANFQHIRNGARLAEAEARRRRTLPPRDDDVVLP